MPKIWRIIDLIHWAESYFQEKGFRNPRAEIEWLLRSVLDCSRMDVYLRFEEPLSQSQLDTLRTYVKRRLNKEPLQYITGSCDFYGRNYFVNEYVLIPRPETERLVDCTLEKVKEINSPDILDVGTGSGCIAITLGLELKRASIIGLDISDSALRVANQNKKKNSIDNVSFHQIDFLCCLPEGEFDLVVSNPPYVSKLEMSGLMKDVREFEPTLALTDNKDGLTFYRRFAEIGNTLVKKGGSIILELGVGNHPQKAKSIFEHEGYADIQLLKDLNGDDRILIIGI